MIDFDVVSSIFAEGVIDWLIVLRLLLMSGTCFCLTEDSKVDSRCDLSFFRGFRDYL